MNIFDVELKSAAPSGVSTVADRPYRRALVVRIPNFMLEDVVDAAEARAALANPENASPVPWNTLKEQLGL